MSTTVPVPPQAQKVNFWTHLIFPARSLYKDIVYWPTEIAAGVILFIWIAKFDLVETQDANNNTVKMYRPDPTKPQGAYGITGPGSPSYQQFPSNLLNQEFAWICLCYAIKHFFYLIDTVMWVTKKFCKAMDIVPPLLNMLLWGLWGLYGWLHIGDEIHAGEYVRVAYDIVDVVPGGNSAVDAVKQAAKDNAKNWYKANAKWTWLWVPTAAVALILLILWLVNLGMRRSSAVSNVAISTWLIPLQLFFLHLFLKGSWINSNVKYYAKDGNESKSNPDIFEARYVFPIIYFAAWIGLLFAIACIFKSVIDMRYHLTNFIKFLLYAAFWVSGFLWVLCMDMTLYHFEVKYWRGLMITHIICLACALFIGMISIFQKAKDADRFVQRHLDYYSWVKTGDPQYYN